METMPRTFCRFPYLLLSLLSIIYTSTFASDANSILKKWNVIVSKDVVNVGEVEGRIFIGGNYSVTNSHQFGFKLYSNPNTDIVFAVQGGISTNTNAAIKVFYGSAAVGTAVSNSSWFSFQNGGKLYAPSVWPANNSPINDIVLASDYWKTLPANSTVQIPSGQPGPLKFNCSSTEPVAVFTVTDQQTFDNSFVQQFELNVSSNTQTVIINVNSIDGNINWTSGNMTGKFTDDAWRSRIIWNIYTNANNGHMGNIAFNSGLGGSLISPTATLSTNSNIDGCVVVEKLNIQSEIHNPNGGWQGNLPNPPQDCKNDLGGVIFRDKNQNGLQDKDEQGIADIQIELVQNNQLVSSQKTGLDGKYLFSQIANGSYTLRVASSNFSDSGPFANFAQTKWYATADKKSSDISLNCNNNLAVNFGFYKTSLNFSKSASIQSAKPADKITYTFTVENMGDLQLKGVDVSDKMLNPQSPYLVYHIDQLNSAELLTFSKDYTIKSTDCGNLVNTASALAIPADGSASLNLQASASVNVDCGLQGVNNWNANLGLDSAICQQDAKWIPVNAAVHLTPNPSAAYLQTSWRIVKPDDGSVDNSTHYSSVPITKDTSFSINAFWPGIRPDDKIVEIHYGINVLDINGNPIKNGVGRDLYWNPDVCPPPQPKEADIKIEKTVSNSKPKNGEIVNYSIKVINNGPGEAKGVKVSDVLPDVLLYQSYNASQGEYDKTSGLWTVGNLDNGASAQLTVSVKVDCQQINNTAFDLGIAKDFNLFVIQDATQPSSDTEGKVAVGHDASFGNYSIGDKLRSNSDYVLVVGRNLNFNSGRVYNGDVAYGNSTNLPLTQVSIDGNLKHDSPVNFQSAKTYLENLSATLSTYTTNANLTFQWGCLNLKGTDPFLNVFHVNGDDLSKANNFVIDVPNAAVVLVNIDGLKVNWTGGLTVNGTALTNVLYNFYQANELTIQGIDVRGSVLAPLAAVNFISGVQNGQMICRSLSGQGQFNYSLFLGNIPYDKKVTNIASLSGSLTNDPVASNNSSSADFVISSSNTENIGETNGQWKQVSTFSQNEIIYSMTYHDNAIFTGTIGGSIYSSTDGGINWLRINQDMNTGWIWSLCFHNGKLFAATEKGVYKFSGSSWTLTNLKNKDVHALCSANGSLYAGTWGYGVYRSSDEGENWIQINDGLGDFLAIQSLTSETNGNILAGSFGGGIFKLPSGENKWLKHDVGNNIVWSLCSSGNTIYAGLYNDGLYRSIDHGANWQKVQELNLPFVYSITVDLNGKVYLSSWSGGVYTLDSNGNNPLSMGMGGQGVSSLMVNPDSKEILIGTKDGKIFMIKDTETTKVRKDNNVIVNYSLSQNYPNPFNPSTTIEFALPAAGKYSLKVYNILGQELSTLVNEYLSSGVYKVNFNAWNLPSGIYIYRLTGNNVNISSKMILMK
ncbi:MAG: choice-of-anchor A family protein [Bacteroidota bacterium]|nr:choice-of-anchor A family protein [Bacteroidota bacterium]